MKQASNNKSYDLEERTAAFGEAVIRLCRSIKEDTITRPVILQLVRSATSIGANYQEANGASSKRDFANKMFIAKKEAQETKHWLRMLATCAPQRSDDIRALWKESQELTLIFNKITASVRLKIKP